MRAVDFCGGNALPIVCRCGAILASAFFGYSGNAIFTVRHCGTARSFAINRRSAPLARTVLCRSGNATFAVSHCGTARSFAINRRCAASPLTVTRRSMPLARAALCRSGNAIFAVSHCGTARSLTADRLRTSSMRVVHPCIRPRFAFFVRTPPHIVERSRPAPPSRRGLHGFQNPFVVHFAQQGEQLFLLHSGIPSFCISSLSLRRMRARIVRIAPSPRPVRRASSAISSRNQ